jgi:hypothetical protein
MGDMDDERRDPMDPGAQEQRRWTANEPPPMEMDPFDEGEDGIDGDGREANDRDPGAIRAEDTEPYFALQYVARLFKITAMVVMVALAVELVAGIALEGLGAIIPLMAELIRGIVLAAILWGVGDLTVLLIDVGHDVRAARVLLGRISARAQAEPREDEEDESWPPREV